MASSRARGHTRYNKGHFGRMEAALQRRADHDEEIEARLLGLEILVTGLFGILARTRAIAGDELRSELDACETEMRKLNAHEELIVMLRTARKHVEAAEDM